MPNPLSSALRDEVGATSIEYGLIAAAISVILLTTVALIGTELQSVFQRVADAL
jgi:pilus assembly protein Flp/PilA